MHSLAKDILNIKVHCPEENIIKNIIHHLKYGNFGQGNTTVRPYHLKVLLWRYSLMNSMQKDYPFPKIEGIYFTIKIYHKLLVYTDPCSPFVVSSNCPLDKNTPRRRPMDVPIWSFM